MLLRLRTREIKNHSQIPLPQRGYLIRVQRWREFRLEFTQVRCGEADDRPD
jgi:hypothetical protein